MGSGGPGNASMGKSLGSCSQLTASHLFEFWLLYFRRVVDVGMGYIVVDVLILEEDIQLLCGLDDPLRRKSSNKYVEYTIVMCLCHR
jgi:hypothetical protein